MKHFNSAIEGLEYDVISLKHQSGIYLADDMVPGIEWLMATCEVDGQQATRRLRVIPTASIEAGPSVVVTDYYDHADDAEMFYSTAKRMAVNEADITTGIYPDGLVPPDVNGLTTRQHQFAHTDMSNGNNEYRDVPVEYMSNGTDNAHSGKLYVYVYDVTGFSPTDNEILRGPLLDFGSLPDPASPDTLGEQMNELKPFSNRDWRYLVSYMWVLNDGRVLQNAKLVRRAEVPFDVELKLSRNDLLPANLYSTGGYLYTGVGTTPKPVLTDFTNFTTAAVQAAQDTSEARYKEHAQTAWLLKHSSDSLKSVTLTMKISATESYSVKVDNPTNGSMFTVPVTQYRIVYRDGGYYTIPETVNRVYALRRDAASGAWYLSFDKTNDDSQTGYRLNDVETNTIVDVVVASTLGDLTISKTVAGTNAPVDNSLMFTFRATFSDGGAYAYTGSSQGVLQSAGTLLLSHDQ